MSSLYLEHFRLGEAPFGITPNGKFFFEGQARGAILDALHHEADAFERDYLERAIAHFGSVGEAAKRLGVDRTTIFRKMKKAAGE